MQDVSSAHKPIGGREYQRVDLSAHLEVYCGEGEMENAECSMADCSRWGLSFDTDLILNVYGVGIQTSVMQMTAEAGLTVQGEEAVCTSKTACSRTRDTPAMEVASHSSTQRTTCRAEVPENLFIEIPACILYQKSLRTYLLKYLHIFCTKSLQVIFIFRNDENYTK